MMFLFHVVLATFTFVSFVEGGVVSSFRTGSNGDQYQRQEGTEGSGQPQAELARFHDKDATDRELVHMKNPKQDPQRASAKIGHNSTHRMEKTQHNSKLAKSTNDIRNKRSYYSYPGYSYQIPQFQSINAWRPSFYPVQRPYYIPIYGIDGSIPLYIPPQPFYTNPGTPPKNPEKPPYAGPTYLPPVGPTYLPPSTSEPDESTTMPTDNRYGGNDYDDRPIWDNGNDQPDPTRAPPPVQPSVVPTRKPSSSKTFPPLVHKDGKNVPNNVNHLSSNGNEIRPATTEAPPKQPPGPSRCVWAIVSCCSTSSKEVSYNCFDQLGCSGPFWDVSPCETEYAKAAIESALNYYNSRS